MTKTMRGGKVKIIHLKWFYLQGQEAKWFPCCIAWQQT